MNPRVFALLAATLFLVGCGSSDASSEQAYAAPLPSSNVGTMRTSNEYWNSQRPYAWDSGSTGIAGGNGSATTSSSASSRHSSSSGMNGGGNERGWLARVGMSPQWGPDGHEYGDRNPGQLPAEEGFMPENFQYAYDNDFGFVATEDESGSTTSNGGTGSTSSNSGGGLRLPSGQTAGGSGSNSSGSGMSSGGGLRLPSGRTVDGQPDNGSSSSGGNGTITLPSGRVIDGQSNDQAMNGTGSTVRLASGGGRGCNQPDQGDVTGGAPGVTFPVLYKGTCPVTTTILRVPDKQDSVFGSMDF